MKTRPTDARGSLTHHAQLAAQSEARLLAARCEPRKGGREVHPDSSHWGHFSKWVETTTLHTDSGDLGQSLGSATNPPEALGKQPLCLSEPLLSHLYNGRENKKYFTLS